VAEVIANVAVGINKAAEDLENAVK
jgi:hypothetical protein